MGEVVLWFPRRQLAVYASEDTSILAAYASECKIKSKVLLRSQSTENTSESKYEIPLRSSSPTMVSAHSDNPRICCHGPVATTGLGSCERWVAALQPVFSP